MPRVKKVSDNKSRKAIEDEVDEILAESETVPKKTRKVQKKVKEPSEDEISEINEFDNLDSDEEEEPPVVESSDNDSVVKQKPRQPFKKNLVDPTTPIGELSIVDGLRYYIQLGESSCNPQLRQGALNLLRQLTGRYNNRRRYQNGSKTNRNYQNQRFPGSKQYVNAKTDNRHNNNRNVRNTDIYDDEE